MMNSIRLKRISMIKMLGLTTLRPIVNEGAMKEMADVLDIIGEAETDIWKIQGNLEEARSRLQVLQQKEFVPDINNLIHDLAVLDGKRGLFAKKLEKTYGKLEI